MDRQGTRRYSRRINPSHLPRIYALKFVILSDLADSVAFTRMDCRLTGSIPLDVYLMTQMAVDSTSGCLYFYGPVKLFILALHDNKEALLFLQKQLFDSFTINLYPSALLPCSAAYKMTLF
jgi:hypothetical protein